MEHEIFRKQIVEAGKYLLSSGLVVRTWGNISLRVDETYILITPSGRRYEDLALTDLVLVNYHTLDYKSSIKPSSETELHSAIYCSRNEINAVIHTHQQYASAVAVAGKKIPAITDDQAQILGASVRLAKYALTGSKQLVNNTLNALKDRMAALMSNHGAICLGRNLDEAFTACQMLEKTSKIFIDAQALGGVKPIKKSLATQLHLDYLNNYSVKALKNV